MAVRPCALGRGGTVPDSCVDDVGAARDGGAAPCWSCLCGYRRCRGPQREQAGTGRAVAVGARLSGGRALRRCYASGLLEASGALSVWLGPVSSAAASAYRLGCSFVRTA